MPSSYDRIVVHDTFSTKYRMPLIDENIEEGLHAVIASVLIEQGCIVYKIGGTEDHVHLVHTLPRTKSIAGILNAVKSISSGWVHKQGEQYEWFGWQDGYSTFSADYRNLDGLIRYVSNQKEHHGQLGVKMSFRQEHTRMLVAYGHEDFTPKYVFPDPPADWNVGEPTAIYSKRERRLGRRSIANKRRSFYQGRRPVNSSEGVHPLAYKSTG